LAALDDDTVECGLASNNCTQHLMIKSAQTKKIWSYCILVCIARPQIVSKECPVELEWNKAMVCSLRALKLLGNSLDFATGP